MNMAPANPNFNDLVNDALRTNSRIIAQRFGKRHDNVLRDIATLVSQNAEWGVLNFEETPYVDPQNGQSYKMYEMTRDGYSMLAMGFTGAAALEWKIKFLEAFSAMEAVLSRNAPVPAGLPDFTNPAEAARAWADEKEQNQIQAAQITAMREDVDAHHRLTKADGSVTITEAAKNLGMRPKDLFQWLQSNRWIYKRLGSSAWLGYQTRCNSGDLEHKTTTVLRADGSEKITEQVRITAKGLSKLAKLIKPTAEAA